MSTLDDLARELDLLRRRAARGSDKTKVSLEELGRRIELPRSTVHVYVTGRTLPSADALDRVVIALGASATEQRAWSEAWFRVSARAADARRAVAPAGFDPPRELPSAAAAFTGRDAQLDQLDEALAGPIDGRTARLVTIVGTAGVGKTALALRWAHCAAHRYPDGQLYVNLHGYGPGDPTAPQTVLVHFLGALGVSPDRMPSDLDALTGLFRTRLGQRRVLIVLDNAAGADQVRPLLPSAPSCAVLVTSRDELRGLSIHDGARSIALNRLSVDESLALFGRVVGQPRLSAEPAAATAIARRCAGLPLALLVVADRVARDATATLARIAEQLLDETAPLASLATGADEASDLRSTFSWSYAALRPDAARLFRLLGLNPGPDISLDAASALAGSSVAVTRRLLDGLCAAHLVESVDRDRYQLHDLLRAYAAELVGRRTRRADQRRACADLADYYLSTCAAAVVRVDPSARTQWPDRAAEGADLDPFATTQEATDWLTAERTNLLALAAQAAAKGLGRYTIALSDRLAHYLLQRAYHADARALHTNALAAAEQADDQEAVERALWVLGITDQHLGRVDEARVHLDRAAASARRVGRPESEARSTAELGWLLALAGCHDEAIRLCRQAADIAHGCGYRTGEAMAANNLGLVLRRLGRLDEAAEAFERALSCSRRVGDRETAAAALNNLGLIHQGRGRLDEAKEHFRNARVVAQELGHPEGQGFSAVNLGHAHLLGGDYDVGERLVTDALRIARDSGIGGLETVALNYLGKAALAQGQPDRALRHYQAAIRRAGETGDRLQRGRAAEGLACANRDLGNRTAARQHLRYALATYLALEVPDVDRARATLQRLDARPDAGSTVGPVSAGCTPSRPART